MPNRSPSDIGVVRFLDGPPPDIIMRWLFVLLAVPLVVLGLYTPPDEVDLYMERSIPYVGAGPATGGLTGKGVVVAVIDTGIDYNHPDLYGFGTDGKVIGGYNFISPGTPPIDNNGHGTQVSGIIAADNVLRGVAPDARLLVYKVSENGEGVSPDLIVRAIRMALQDGADIINISLGVNKTNDAIDNEVTEAARQGVLVVAAAGNDGPGRSTIGSPGHNMAALTVGATYNNLTVSRVAVLEVDGKQYTVAPMIDSVVVTSPVSGPVVFGGYARQQDLDKVDASGSILLAERGSDTPGEMVYFSIKEHNAAEAGALAIIVFNNQDGLFFGELVHEFIEPDYIPRIPAVSMERADGLKILEDVERGVTARLQLIYDPDHPVPFSSRGPVSPIFVKPDMMAPGAYINTTTIQGYDIASGTSYATPHVSGAAALLMELHPGITPEQIRSILTTTAEQVIDINGNRSNLSDAGSGRLDIATALKSRLVISPSVIVAGVSPEDPVSAIPISIQTLDGLPYGDITVQYDTPDTMTISHEISYAKDPRNPDVILHVQTTSDATGFVTITDDDNIKYTMPVIAYYTQGTITATEDAGTIHIDISHPDGWSFAKIMLFNRVSDVYQISATPDKPAQIQVDRNGTYYITANIVTKSESVPAYGQITVDSVDASNTPDTTDMPWRHAAIAGAVAVSIGAVGVLYRVIPGGRQRRYQP